MPGHAIEGDGSEFSNNQAAAFSADGADQPRPPIDHRDAEDDPLPSDLDLHHAAIVLKRDMRGYR